MKMGICKVFVILFIVTVVTPKALIEESQKPIKTYHKISTKYVMHMSKQDFMTEDCKDKLRALLETYAQLHTLTGELLKEEFGTLKSEQLKGDLGTVQDELLPNDYDPEESQLRIDEFDPKGTSMRDPCAKIKCEPGRKCEFARNGSALCTCVPKCSTERNLMKKVCSNQNETWDSECELNRMRCLCADKLRGCKLEKYKNVHVSHSGPCAGFQITKCEPGSQFPADKKGNKTCTCVDQCPTVKSLKRKVCSNHNETWESKCELDKMRCMCLENSEGCKYSNYKDVHAEYYGPCTGLGVCTPYEMKDFARRIREWFVIVIEDHAKWEEMKGVALEVLHTTGGRRWVNAVIWKFCDLDVLPRDRHISKEELLAFKSDMITMESCLVPFLQNCDADDDEKITLLEWGHCFGLEDNEIKDKCDE